MYGEGFDIGNLAPDQVGVGADGAREGVTAATGPSAALLLPPPEGVPAWLAALIERDGERAIIKAVLATIPGDRVMAITEELCSQRFGTEPILSDDSLAFQETRWEGPSGRPSSPSTLLLTRKRPRTERAALEFEFDRCWACEPSFGHRADTCTAMLTLSALYDELKAQLDSVDEEEELGDVNVEARRSARYYMYREYVKRAFGFLGRKKRVRIPMCVVEYIRDKLREPGCKCKLGGPLYACKLYTGHRDAPAEE